MKKPNRLQIHLYPIFAAALLMHFATPSAHAQSLYWDNNGATTGFGDASGTWAAPTTGNASQGWSTDGTGETLPVDVTTGTGDAVFFGNGATGLGAGTITVSGTVNAANMTFASGSGDIVLNGGTISAATSARSIAVGGGVHTINSVLSGGVGRTVAGSGTLVLNGPNTFTGPVIIGNSTASTLVLRVNSIGNLSAASSLGAPTTATNGLIQIGTATESSTLELVGSSAAQTTNRQVRVGANAGGGGGATIRNNNTDPAHSLTFTNATFNQNNTGSTSGSDRTLTLGGSNTGNNTISGQIIELLGSGVMPVTKTGAGTWILNGANSYDGTTTVNGGILVLGGSNSTNTATTVSGTGTLQLNSNSNGGLASGVLNFSSNTAVLQAINADRTITNQLTIPGSSNAATVSGDFSLAAGSLRLLNGNKILTNNINPLKSLTVGSITANGNYNLGISGNGVTLVTGSVVLGVGANSVTKNTGGMLKFSTTGSNTLTNVVISSGATGGAFVATNNGQHVSTGNFTLADNSTLVIDYGSSTPSTTTAPLAVTDFTVGSGLSLLVQGNEVSTLEVDGIYPLVTWSGDGPTDGTAFTTILTHRLQGTLSVLNKTLRLTVTANAAGSPISWATGNGTWNTSDTNWVDSVLDPADYFDTLDAVLFGDAGVAIGNRVVTLDEQFSPVSVTMSSTARDYTISGLGSIGGATGLTLGAGNTRKLTLTTANAYTGQTAINGGTLSLGNGGTSGSLAAASAINVASGASFAVNQSDTATQGTDFGVISGSGAFAQTGGGTTVLTSVNTYSGSTSVNSGILQIGGAGRLGNGNYPGDISIAGGSSIQYASSATQTLSGNISGAGSLVKQSGSGSLTLSGINAYEGGTTVNGTLSVANVAAIPSTNTISMADGSVLRPTIDGVIINAPITLGGIGTTAQINGPFTTSAGGTVETLTLNQPITGDGNLRLFGSSATFNTNGTIVLNAQSNYTGSTELDTAGETVHLVGVNLFVKLGIANALPTTTVLTLDGDVGRGSGRTVSFDLNGFNQTLAGLASNTTLTARNQRVTNNGSLATLTINSSTDSQYGGTGPETTFSGDPVIPTAKITGNLALTKTGTAKFTLLGVHEYTGDTTVSQGILSLSADNTFNNASTVTIATAIGAQMELNFEGTDTVDKLFYGSTQQPSGNYSASSVPPGATIPTTRFIGAGILFVASNPASGYAAWADDNADGQGSELDFDNDGVRNGVEFFMNASPGFTANPQLNASKTITWPNGGNIPASAYGTQFVVQTSSTLSGWTNVQFDDPNLINTNGSLSYTLTGGSPRFVRLSVTPN